MSTIIKTEHGYSVECYGTCNEYATIEAVFDNEIFDSLIDGSFKNWREAVKEVADYAKRMGTELVQLESDE
jgi:hypothetical protein